MPISIYIVSLSPSRAIQHYAIKFVIDLQAGWWFSLGPPVSSINKTDRHDITEILLKVALNTTTLNPSNKVLM